MGSNRSETGAVLMWVSISLFLLAVCAAFTVDLGVTYHEQRRIEFAADAGAQAAAALLPATQAVVEAEAKFVAGENGLDVSAGSTEVQAVECGVWQASSFVPCVACGSGGSGGSNSSGGSSKGKGKNASGGGATGGSPACTSACQACDSGATAVRVVTDRAVPTFFAPVMGIYSLNPVETAVAASNAGQFCVRPFGIWEDVLTGLTAGDRVIVGNQSPGNWGKLDICKQMSSGTNFRDAMLNGVCCGDTTIGDAVSTGTGFGGSIKHVFDDVIAAGKQNDMIFEVNSQFSNGNSQVTIFNFIKVNLIAHGGNGNNWWTELEIVEYPTIPPSGTAALGATLVQ